MSKFKCECGHVIVDDGRHEYIKGLLLRDQSFEVAYEEPSATVAGFIRAVSEGKRKEWIENFYDQPYFEIKDSSVVFDIWDHARLRCGLAVYQCEACGRIYIEREPQQSSGLLRCFKPEDADWKGTLAVQLPPESATVSVPSAARKTWWRFW